MSLLSSPGGTGERPSLPSSTDGTGERRHSPLAGCCEVVHGDRSPRCHLIQAQSFPQLWCVFAPRFQAQSFPQKCRISGTYSGSEFSTVSVRFRTGRFCWLAAVGERASLPSAGRHWGESVPPEFRPELGRECPTLWPSGPNGESAPPECHGGTGERVSHALAPGGQGERASHALAAAAKRRECPSPLIAENN